MIRHRATAALQGRHLIRQADEISARHDSPNGGLRALLAANAALIAQRTEIQATLPPATTQEATT